jgi:hypothetical protein
MPRNKYKLDESRFEATKTNIDLTHIKQHEEAIKHKKCHLK